MSRIGRKPIVIPAGVEVKVDAAEHAITVKGPKGTLHSKFHPLMNVAVEGNEILVTRPNDEKEARSLHGLTRTLIHNMVVGVTEGFRKDLEIQGVGYRAAKQGSKLTLTLEGRLDTTTAPQLEGELKGALEGVTNLEFDFQNLEYLSSAGLRVLLAAQKAMNKQGNMVIRHVNETIQEVFEVTGFVDILTIE